MAEAIRTHLARRKAPSHAGAASLAAAILLAGVSSTTCRAEATADADQAAEAARRAVQFLWSQQLKGGNWPELTSNNRRYDEGPTALAAYALLESGAHPRDARLAKALDWLATCPTNNATYCLGILCNVWLKAAKADPRFAKLLQRDTELLVRSTADGSYDYRCRGDGTGRGDHSNSQFAVLGVWAGARGGLAVPASYWALVHRHWAASQNPDGGWGYDVGGPTRPTMAAAGLATTLVCADFLALREGIDCKPSPANKTVQGALDWLDKNFARSLADNIWYEYYLYSLERVALAGGHKHFGGTDWFKLGLAELLRRQNADGSWSPHGDNRDSNKVVSTSLALLFLARGRQPILVNRLQYKGDWNNRPRAAAALSQWMSDAFERDFHWQVVDVRTPPEDWHDAPVLLITGSAGLDFTPEDLDRLRAFVRQGGLILSCAECGGQAFKAGMRQAYATMFPQYPLRRCAPDHPVYSVQFALNGKPSLYEVSNGIRALAFHCDEDLALQWQLRAFDAGRSAFHLAANVIMSATAKGRSWGIRGQAHWPAQAEFQPQRSLKLARLKHAGDCDPEPLAYERFSRLMGAACRVAVEVAAPLEIQTLSASGAKVATLTGTGELALSGNEKAAMKAFVAGGGTLVIDAAGGSPAFAKSAERALAEMFGEDAPKVLPPEAPVYNLPDMRIERVAYRPASRERRPHLKDKPDLRAVTMDGRAAVIFSPEDLTAGLVGYPSLTCDGYESESAFALMRNIVLYAAGTQALPAAQPAAASSAPGSSAAPPSGPASSSAPAD